MADYVGYLSNLSMRGDQWENGDRPPWKNCLPLRLGRKKCELIQHSDYLRTPKNVEKGSFVHTTDLVIRDVEPSGVPAANRIADDLAALLSFASASSVWHFGESYPRGTANQRVSLQRRGGWQYFRPPIDTLDPPTLRAYLGRAWGPYRKLKRQFKLPEVIDYLVQAEDPRQVVEIQLAIAFLVLEGLKHSHAKRAGIPYIKGRFRHPPTPKNKDGAPYGFADLLKEMFKSKGMKPRLLTRTIRARNELFHSSILHCQPAQRFRHYEQTHDVIREYLLRLLDYRGAYTTYTLKSARI
jgi:hypothetical protein